MRGPLTTNDSELLTLLPQSDAGVGLLYVFEPLVSDQHASWTLPIVLEQYAAEVPGLFLYCPSRAQVSPAFRAFVDVAREFALAPRQRSR